MALPKCRVAHAGGWRTHGRAAAQADEKLRETGERFRLAAFSDKIAFYEQDAELRYIWLYPDNPEMPLKLGLTDEEVLVEVEGGALLRGQTTIRRKRAAVPTKTRQTILAY